MMLTEILGIEDIMIISIIFFFSFIGSFTKVYLKLLRFKDGTSHKLNLMEVMLSTFTATVIVFAFSDCILVHLTVRGLVMVSFVSGLVGFEMLIRISSINGIVGFLRDILDVYGCYVNISSKNKRNRGKEDNRLDE